MPNPDDPITHLIRMWQAAVGPHMAEPQPGTRGPRQLREIGHYASETLYELATTGAQVVSDLDDRQRSHLAQGAILKWRDKTRTLPERQTLAALMFAADLLHAAIDGVRASGHIDLGDAHDFAVKLQECLVDCAVRTDIITDVMEGLQQLLAEAAGGED